MIDWLLELLYPIKCIVCGKITHDKQYLCAACESDLHTTDDNVKCKRCSRVMINNVCSNCKNNFVFDKNYSIFDYDGVIKDLIHDFKYNNHPELGRGFGNVMCKRLNAEFFSDIDYITSVPIHPLRNISRGFNQSEIIAKVISKRFDVPYRNLILRIKNTKPQWELNKHEREDNLKNAFRVSLRDFVVHKNIVIVDDIFTTGSTINGCASELKRCGANKVISLTLSMTQYENTFGTAKSALDKDKTNML